MNTGVEGGETAVKLARKWGYDVKGVPKYQVSFRLASAFDAFFASHAHACSFLTRRGDSFSLPFLPLSLNRPRSCLPRTTSGGAPPPPSPPPPTPTRTRCVLCMLWLALSFFLGSSMSGHALFSKSPVLPLPLVPPSPRVVPLSNCPWLCPSRFASNRSQRALCVSCPAPSDCQRPFMPPLTAGDPSSPRCIFVFTAGLWPLHARL